MAPHELPSMAQAIRMLGMGGHLGRCPDGPPVTQLLWRGLQYLDVAVQIYIASPVHPPFESGAPTPRDICRSPRRLDLSADEDKGVGTSPRG
mgnify:FL=1